MSEFRVRVLKPFNYSPTGVFGVTTKPGDVVDLSASSFAYFTERGEAEPTQDELTHPQPGQSDREPLRQVEPEKKAAEPAPETAAASPAAKTKAEELGEDLATVSGTGKGGMITVADVINAAAGE